MFLSPLLLTLIHKTPKSQIQNVLPMSTWMSSLKEILTIGPDLHLSHSSSNSTLLLESTFFKTKFSFLFPFKIDFIRKCLFFMIFFILCFFFNFPIIARQLTFKGNWELIPWIEGLLIFFATDFVLIGTSKCLISFIFNKKFESNLVVLFFTFSFIWLLFWFFSWENLDLSGEVMVRKSLELLIAWNTRCRSRSFSSTFQSRTPPSRLLTEPLVFLFLKLRKVLSRFFMNFDVDLNSEVLISIV